MSIYKKWAEKEYSLSIRLIATFCAGIIFVFLVPLFLIKAGASLDHSWNMPDINIGLMNKITGGAALLTGIFFALWSIITQIQIGRGTPIPVLATQELLIIGPFKYCRNPMSFGAILGYLGLSIFMASLSMILLTACFTLLLTAYIKFLEEKELIERFGKAYLEYMHSTAFIIPRFN